MPSTSDKTIKGMLFKVKKQTELISNVIVNATESEEKTPRYFQLLPYFCSQRISTANVSAYLIWHTFYMKYPYPHIYQH